MSTLEDLASKLAEDTLALQDATGEERLFMEVAAVLGAASQTLEEAYLTEVRVRMAEVKARTFLREKIKQAKANGTLKTPGVKPAKPDAKA